MRVLLFLFILFCSSSSWAGYFEIGTTYNFRQNYVDELNKTVSSSITASVAYYFWELSALEVSYTEGSTDVTLQDLDVDIKFQMTGVDLVISFAGRQAPFRPYVKLGAVHQVKSTRYVFSSNSITTVKSSGTSPSAGLGFRLLLTKNFVLRTGVDAWASPKSGDDTQFDLVGRAGISWMF